MKFNKEDRFEQGSKGVAIGLVAYILLSFVKIEFGVMGDSEALVADGWNNVSDVIATLVILFGLKIARKPADKDHRYGHFRAETAAALIAAIVMAFVGIDVLKNTGGELLSDSPVNTPGTLTMYIAIIGAIVMYGVYRYNRHIAEKTNNLAVMAAALDNRSDALVSLSVVIGIVTSRFGWTWADPLVAVIIAIIILKTAWRVGYDAVHALMDGFDADKLSDIEQKVDEIEGIREVLDVRARFHGSTIHVDLTIGLDHHLTVVESHALTEKVEEELVGYEGIERVNIHVEPANEV